MSKIDFNITENRNDVIRLNGLVNTDNRYTFYYDETNNIRKLWFKDGDKLNITKDNIFRNFVLGGILHDEAVTITNFNQLRTDLQINDDVEDIKLKTLAKGDFLKCLNSRKVTIFLDWLVSNDLFVHYSSLDVLYWSLIDILESMIPTNLLFIHMELKTALYEIAKIDLDSFLSMLYKYHYPNINRIEANNFLDDLTQYIRSHKSKFSTQHPYFNSELIDMVIDIITNSKDKKLPFIMDEKPHILIENLFTFYQRPLGLYRNSHHIFDEEIEIQVIFDDYEFNDNGIPWKSFEFQKSHDNGLIQVSDIFAGLMGKMFTYINQLEMKEIELINSKLNKRQLTNFKSIAMLIENAEKQSKGFTRSIQSMLNMSKMEMLLSEITK